MHPNFKIALNIFSIFIAALFIAPTAAITVSWNAIPGDALYSTKRTLEQAALAITAPNYKANSELQTKLVARRTNEAADTIIKRGSTKGLDELKAQMDELRAQISAAPNPEEKRVVAQKAVTQLRKSKKKLKQTKTTLAQAPPTVYTNITIQQQITQYIPIFVSQQATPTPIPTPPSSSPTNDIIDQIDNSTDDIDDTIDDIQEVLGDDIPLNQEDEVSDEPDPSDEDSGETETPTPEPFPPTTSTPYGPGQGQGQGMGTAPGQQNSTQNQ